MIIGIDDTDSKAGGCTTYLGAILKRELEHELNTRIEARLIRLNPTIKYKTRGNAAISLKMEGFYEVRDLVERYLRKMAYCEDDNTHPGAVVLDRDVAPSEVKRFSRDAVHAELTIEQARHVIDKHGLDSLEFKHGRGLIGALAAVGATYDMGHSYELIAYRREENFGTKRYINRDSVFMSDLVTYPFTWDTVDRTNNGIVFSPHSPDPILYGIRGDSPQKILHAQRYIISEPFALLVMWKTNQGTDAHIRYVHVRDLHEGASYCVVGTVETEPWTIEGGHTFFAISDGQTLLCAAFEPTREFREVIRDLRRGDRVRVYGSYLNGCLNLEKVRVVELADLLTYTNPMCCNKSMKSMGTGQGFRCGKCGNIREKRHTQRVKLLRTVQPGFYEPPPSARRHLSMPVVRLRERGFDIYPSR